MQLCQYGAQRQAIIQVSISYVEYTVLLKYIMTLGRGMFIAMEFTLNIFGLVVAVRY